MRTKRTLINTMLLFIYQIVAAICGFILPKYILLYFGSTCNGLISSITQFISCVVLLRCGVGAVTRAALYKPLIENDSYSISRIVKATNEFMHKVAWIFVIYLIVLACVFPLCVKSEFSWIYIFSLILILGISTVIENYFGIPYLIVLEAEQKKYIIVMINILIMLVNVGVSVLLITNGYRIHVVKLCSAFLLSIAPIFLFFYIRNEHHIQKEVTPDNNALSQRWDAFSIQVAYYVNNNTDVMLLSLLANVSIVSVYAVYHMVVQALSNVVTALCGSVGPAFGNMHANREKDNLENGFKLFEFIIFSTSTFMYVSAIKLITPFIQVYTMGISDISYNRSFFGYIMCVNYYFLATRAPYEILVEAVGHFKQVKRGALFEAVINIIVSIVLVIWFGLIGVAIGTLCGALYRTVQYAVYAYKNVIRTKLIRIFKNYIVSVMEMITVLLATSKMEIRIESYAVWGLDAVKVSVVVFCTVLCFSFILYREEIKMLVVKIRKLRNGSKKV